MLKAPDNFKVTRVLADLEMFKLIDRLGLEISSAVSEPRRVEKPVPVCAEDDFDQLMTRLKNAASTSGIKSSCATAKTKASIRFL